jgi:ABC-2 type transport system permease protein
VTASGSGRPTAVFLTNALRAFGRSLLPDERRERIAASIAIFSAIGFALLLGWGASALLAVTRTGLAQLPELQPGFLLVHLLRALYAGAAFLLLLGSLTSSVSLLFLSDDLPALLPLPISHRRLFLGLLLRSIGAASAPTWFLATPLVAVAALHSPSPSLTVAALSLSLLSVVLVAGGAGAVAALLLVRIVPPRRARLLAATLSAVGLAGALVGIRGARPERLFDPMQALEILRRLGTVPPAPSTGPAGWLAAASYDALSGSVSGLAAAAALAAGALMLVTLVAVSLAPVHLATWRRSAESSSDMASGADRRIVRSLGRELLAAEGRSFLREASTPAQLGSLVAVFVLDLLNLRLLPAHDAAARDLVGGVQTALALFLVSALSLRFAYPAVSADGRAALVLRSFPLSPGRHLAARYAVRAFPAVVATLFLIAVSGAALRLDGLPLAASLATGLVGALSIPALHLGLGALYPRYGASSAVAAALGPGGLFAMAASTVLALLAAPVVSQELRALLSVLSGLRLDERALLAAWCGLSLLAGATPLLLAVRSLGRRDVSLA